MMSDKQFKRRASVDIIHQLDLSSTGSKREIKNYVQQWKADLGSVRRQGSL